VIKRRRKLKAKVYQRKSICGAGGENKGVYKSSLPALTDARDLFVIPGLFYDLPLCLKKKTSSLLKNRAGNQKSERLASRWSFASHPRRTKTLIAQIPTTSICFYCIPPAILT